jgi:hypothetical protein
MVGFLCWIQKLFRKINNSMISLKINKPLQQFTQGEVMGIGLRIDCNKLLHHNFRIARIAQQVKIYFCPHDFHHPDQ